jgi:hypothetical protein
VLNFHCFKSDNLIMGGRFELYHEKKRGLGGSARVDQLAEFFSNRFEVGGLVDVEPLKISPTWSNNRSGREGVFKILDIFVVHNMVLQKVPVTGPGLIQIGVQIISLSFLNLNLMSPDQVPLSSLILGG